MRAILMCAAYAAVSVSASAQSTSVWVDANAAHSRPPTEAGGDPATFALLGARFVFADVGNSGELGASFGRGANADAGSWLSGRGSWSSARVAGVLDWGLRGEATALGFITPVRFADGNEYSRMLGSVGVRPTIGLSVGGFRVAGEGLLSAAVSRAEFTYSVTGGAPPSFPLPGGSPGIDRRSAEQTTTIGMAGGSLSVLRVIGPLTLDARGTAYNAGEFSGDRAADGADRDREWYSGVDVTAAFALESLDLSVTARRWRTPQDTAVFGGVLAAGVAIGETAYLQASVARAIPDPLYGASDDLSFGAGLSVRVGSVRTGPPAPARVGAAASSGRSVTFTLRRPGAQSVAVAGDFSGWEPRALQRSGDEWVLETTLPPGVYHYSFVIDGDEWFVPEHASGLVDDGFGRKNATLVVSGMDKGVAG